MNLQKITMIKRFYVGSTSIANSDGGSRVLKTLHEAMAEGIEKIRDTDHDVIYIVEVVRVIRRKPPVKPEVIVQETR